ncbi:ABC transporter permease [Kordiimonas aestuarii]|uniref:ABC transporter permease n=1 Tax=Kordiimonas aestuarii TaxID=1005925 RepID=UPI0021D01829|nr:ABC transporter permease [Kordiimonas aestuarii]
MTLFAAFLVALEALRLNALRTALAMLGIIIGVAAVITMASISTGAAKRVEEHISSLGTNLLIARPGSNRMGGRRGGAGTSESFSEKDVAAIKTGVYDIAAISGVVNASGAVVYGNTNWQTGVQGVHADFHIARAWGVASGSPLTDEDIRRKSKVAVIGQTVAEELFGSQSPLGERIRIKNIPFEVVGVLAEKGQSGMGRDQDDTILVPISTARTRLVGREGSVAEPVQMMFISVRDGADMSRVQDDIETLLMERRNIKPGAQANFDVRNMSEFIEARTATQNTMGMLLATSAAISLVVGGIGIMNIMLVSVTERTREIGLRMAVGARGRDILVQFLVEAITLCLVGGMIGLAVGAGCSGLVAHYAGWPVLMDPLYVILALAGSATVGLFFGFYPARRASQLNPIDALRYE